jgi:chromate transport protein ChrA
MEESEVLNGYALVSLLPGSLFNISTYTGVITSNSLIGGLIGGFFVYIPGYLLILFCLPYIKNIRNNNKFQYFIRGANSSALGFIFSVAIDLWIDSCFVNPYTDPIMGTLIMFFCIILINLFKIHKTIILLIGTSLNLILRICYNLIRYYHINVGVTIPASVILNNTIGNITNTTIMTNNTNIR